MVVHDALVFLFIFKFNLLYSKKFVVFVCMCIILDSVLTLFDMHYFQFCFRIEMLQENFTTLVIEAYDCKSHINDGYIADDNSKSYCPTVNDGILCWPETPPGVLIAQPCPPLAIFNEYNMAYRKCGRVGQWESFNESIVVIGQSNFELCSHAPTSPTQITNFYEIHNFLFNSSIITLVCLSFSVFAILASFFVYRFVLPKYINEILRVKIHKHLFCTLSFELVLKLVIQTKILLSINHSISVNKPVLCEILAASNKYLEFCVLVWIVNDCHFIYITARSGFLCISGYKGYICMGYLMPVVPILSWVITLIVEHKHTCWDGHMKLASIWIVEVPVILCFVSMAFLLVLSVYEDNKRLRLHLRREAKIITCIKAAWVIVVILFLSFLFIKIPVHIHISDLRQKAIIQYLATTLTSLKGFYIAMLCNYSNIKSFVRKQTQLNDIEL